MKLSHSLLLLGFALCLSAQEAPKTPAASMPAAPPSKVIISVGDSKITAGQFADLIEMLPEQNRVAVKSAAGRRQFADEIVRVLVLAEEGKRRKLDQTPDYKVQAQFQAENLLAGKTFVDMGKSSDAELHKYFDEHKAEFEQIHARHILIRVTGSPVPLDPGKKDLSDAEGLAKAQELRKKIRAGADFDLIAREESDDGSKTAGGDLSFFRRGQMVPPFEQAAFALKVGEISEPVKTPYGYHLIQVEEKREPNFETAKPEIEKRLLPEKSKGVVEDLVKKAKVDLDPKFFGEPDGPPVKK